MGQGSGHPTDPGLDDPGVPVTSMQQSIKVSIDEIAYPFILTDFKAGSLDSIYIISANPEIHLSSNRGAS